MGVLIKDMEKPKSCYAVIDGESEYCPFVNTDDDCVLLLKKGICEGTLEEQYSKCPLAEAAEPCEDVEFWRKRAEFYSKMCFDLIADMNKGIKIDSIEINKDGIKFTKKQTEPCDDTVSRQAAIDAFGLFADIQHVGEKTIRQILTDVPSGQPDIITCEYCKHWKNKHLCESLSRFGSFETKSDFYCGYAERRTDE